MIDLDEIKTWRKTLPEHVARRYSTYAVDHLIAEVERLRSENAGYADGFDTQHAEIERLQFALTALAAFHKSEGITAEQKEAVVEVLWGDREAVEKARKP